MTAEYIDKVALGSISRVSAGDGGYYDGTALSTSMAQGSTQTITLSVGYASSAYGEYFNVWADYNGDKDFTDAGEQLVTNLPNNGLATDLTASFVVPATASVGATRLRISMRDGAGQTSCGSYTYGEVEDYTLNITATGSQTPPCGVPTGLAVGSLTTTGATATWTAVSGAISYNVQYKPTAGSTWTTVSTSGTSYAIASLTAGTAYQVQVQTVCSAGASAYSTAASFTTLTPPPTCGVPTGLAAGSLTTTGATATWTAVSGAISYNVQYKLTAGSSWTTVSTSGLSYAINGLTAATAYQVQVQTVCSAGSSAYSAAVSFTTATPPPTCGVPTGLSALSITIGGATASWTAVSGALSYNVQYKSAVGSTWTSASTSATTYAIPSLTAATAYQVQVQTVCSTGSSAYSTAVSFTTLALPTCSVPTGLVTSSLTTTGATATWTAVSGATSYNVQYKPTAGSTWTTVSSASTSYAMSGLTAATAYQVQVQTVCNTGSSAYSAAVSFTTLALPTCGVPTGLAVGSLTTTGATATWTTVSGAISYNVQYKPTAGSTWTTVANATASRALTGLTPSTAYQVQVQTICSAGSSAYSAAVSFTTATPPPTCGVPTSLAAGSLTTTGATATWTAVGGAISYNVQYKATTASTWTTVSTSGTSYAIASLTAGTAYQVQVQTVCSAGASAYSTAASFTTLTPPPTCGVPTGLAAGSLTTTGATATWTAVSGATSYNVQYKPATGSSWTTVSTSGLSYAINGLTAATAYQVQVQTVCSAGSSAYSAAVSFTTIDVVVPPSCGIPTGVTISSITNASATLSWTAVSGATYNVRFKKSAATTWTTFANTTTARVLSGLASSTNYQVKVQSVCSTGSSAYSAITSFTTAATATVPPVTPTYCASQGTSVTYEYIDKVAIGAISRVSAGDGGYYNGTALSTTVAQGSSQTLTASVGYTGGATNEYFRIYADWNNDGDFSDGGETLATAGASTTAADQLFTFTVPATATIASHRLRVVLSFASATTACGTYSFGETEDYTLVVTTATIYGLAPTAPAPVLPTPTTTPTTPTTPTPQAPTAAVAAEASAYPNPATDVLHVSLSDGAAISSAMVYDQRGAVMTGVRFDGRESLNLSNLPSGIYAVVLSDGTTKYRVRFVKE